MIFLSFHASICYESLLLFFAFHHNLYYLCTFSSKPILVVLKSAPENRSACSVCGKAKGKGLIKESAWSIAYMFTSSEYRYHFFYPFKKNSNTYPTTSRDFFFFFSISL